MALRSVIAPARIPRPARHGRSPRCDHGRGHVGVPPRPIPRRHRRHHRFRHGGRRTAHLAPLRPHSPVPRGEGGVHRRQEVHCRAAGDGLAEGSLPRSGAAPALGPGGRPSGSPRRRPRRPARQERGGPREADQIDVPAGSAQHDDRCRGAVSRVQCALVRRRGHDRRRLRRGTRHGPSGPVARGCPDIAQREEGPSRRVRGRDAREPTLHPRLGDAQGGGTSTRGRRGSAAPDRVPASQVHDELHCHQGTDRGTGIRGRGSGGHQPGASGGDFER
mmetsp:Transcript_11273/g.23620  ORF Transcript_11273/g.23620 Transcript_11273/m.23620 type:complete len:276 (-) Transcript_11273:1087-1914(-)